MRPRRFPLIVIAVLFTLTTSSLGQYAEDSVDVGAGAVGSMIYNSQTDVVYGGCQAAGILFAISCDSNKVVRSLPLAWPRCLDYDTVHNKGYVAFKGASEDSLAVIDGSTHEIARKIEVPGAVMPVWDPVSDGLYVSCYSTNQVAVIDCAADSVLMYIPVGACPIKMYINTLRGKLYVLNYDDGTVSVVNIATNQVIKTVDVGGTPNAGYYCRGADKFYCGGPFRQCVAISGQSDTIVTRITLPGNVEVISATGNEDAGLVYLGTGGGSDDYVATLSTLDDSIIVTTVIGAEPWGLAYYAPSGLLYCASSVTDQVRILSGDGRQILTTVPVGGYPYVFAVAPRHNRLYLGHLNGRYVYVLRDTSAGVMEPRSPHLADWGVSVTPNPFTRSAAVTWNLSAKGGDAARVYAQDGSLVRLAAIPAGQSRWVWDGLDERGRPVPAGVYVVAAPGGNRAKAVKSR